MKKSLLITITIMLFIFIHSAMPGDLSGMESGFITDILAKIFRTDPADLAVFVRKGAHFTEFLALGVSLLYTVKDYDDSRHSLFTVALLSWGIAVLYAMTDEFHQRFVQGRSGEIRDVMIDACGAAAGILIVICVALFRQRIRRL